MTNEWVEASAVSAVFTGEQIDRGRKLVSRDDVLTSEKQRTRLELGDLFLEVAPVGCDEARDGAECVAVFAAKIGLAIGQAREYRSVAACCSEAVRDRVAATGVTVSYSVFREAALGYSLDTETKAAQQSLPRADRDHLAGERFEVLLRLAEQPGRTRVTAAEFREAIGARPVPNQASTMTPGKIAEQLERPEVKAAVFSAVMEPGFLDELFSSDPMSEIKFLDRVAEMRRKDRDEAEPKTDPDGDDRLILLCQRRVRWLRSMVEMQPSQLVNVADAELLDELERAYTEVERWVKEIQNARIHGRTTAS